MDKETFEKEEPVCAKLFYQSRKSDRLAGAYLLYGPKNAPLKEVALYLAQSLNCEKDLLACNECPSCKRFLAGVRPDFLFLDGEKERIKKDSVKDLEKRFSYSALEKGHRLVYVIHHVENITEEAANALLKFLEEPKAGQVAFLTTDNPTQVLKTILSRSISVPLVPYGTKEFEKALLEKEFLSPDGDKPIHLSAGEAYYLSRNMASMEDVENLLKTDSSFREGFAIAENFANTYVTSYRDAAFGLLSQVAQSKEPRCYNWIVEILHFLFSSALIGNQEENPFSDLLNSLQKKKDALQRGEEVCKDAITGASLNYNPTLMLSRLLVALEERSKR